MAKQARPVRRQRARHYIKEWRQHRGLSQEQLADRIDKSRGLISQLESYTTDYTGDTLEAIAYALDCTAHELLRVNPLKERDVVDITDMLRQATPEERAKATGYLEGLVKNRA